MNRTLLLGIACMLALVGISLAGGEQRAVAGHRWHGCHGCFGGVASYGCYGCWGASYGAYDACHGYVRRSCFGCGGCYGGYVSYGCHGCHGGVNCCGGWRVIERGAAHPTGPQQAIPSQPMPESQPQQGVPSGKSPEVNAPNPDSALLRVRVPPQARILVNGQPTRSMGEHRSYVSQGLRPGRHYSYEVRAELARGEETLVETKEVRIRGGQQADLDFRFEPSQTARRSMTKSPDTTLTNY